MDLILKYLWGLAQSNISTSVLLIGISLILTIWTAIKIDRTVNRSKCDQDELKKENEIIRKQLGKLETLIADLPCVEKETATWLQNVNKNGGVVPVKCHCHYKEDLKNKEKNHE